MRTSIRTLCWCVPILIHVSSIHGHEGMWLPTLLKGIEGDMHTAGLKITAEDIYSINSGSIKDAIVLFGGGCTAEVVSDKGLILTNHHCGYSTIQEHSSLTSDYLKQGFWAMSSEEELRNPGLTATFIIRMEDVSDRVLPGLTEEMTELERRAKVSELSGSIVQEAVEGTHYDAVVRPFNYGNSYYMIVSETFRDVRLVGAPPSSIGKFGGDTDNWMWPRHTGDFSVFRIYSAPDGRPADPADGNVPFVPRHVLPIALDGVQGGDFAMIYGFPGSTQRYLSSYAVAHVVEVQDPMRIAMRTASLEVINRAMRQSDRTRIQYAAKQSSVSNAWKKWIGELRGLKELNTVEEKRRYEAGYRKAAKDQGRLEFIEALDDLAVAYEANAPYASARDLFVEFLYYGPDILRFTDGFNKLIEDHEKLDEKGELGAEIDRLRSSVHEFFKDHDMAVEKDIMNALLPLYTKFQDPELEPAVFREIDERYRGVPEAWVDKVFSASMFTSSESLLATLDKFNARAATKMRSDPMYRMARGMVTDFLDRVRPAHAANSDRIERSMRIYLRGMMELFPDRTYWPDANSTLRLSYGTVEGSEPRDAVVYEWFTTLDGMMEKYIPGDPEFDLPQRLIDLHARTDHGRYGTAEGMPVCFTASLHTTGGNSGSPVLNGRGELVGINFDRTWESTMSDIRFDPEKCRNIAVDIRYVLFIIDKFAGAQHLIDEMVIAEPVGSVRIIELPLHR